MIYNVLTCSWGNIEEFGRGLTLLFDSEINYKQWRLAKLGDCMKLYSYLFREVPS